VTNVPERDGGAEKKTAFTPGGGFGGRENFLVDGHLVDYAKLNSPYETLLGQALSLWPSGDNKSLCGRNRKKDYSSSCCAIRLISAVLE